MNASFDECLRFAPDESGEVGLDWDGAGDDVDCAASRCRRKMTFLESMVMSRLICGDKEPEHISDTRELVLNKQVSKSP